MHLRQQEHVHLPGASGDPNAYYFGTSVFTSKEEVVGFLDDIWHQPMDEENPELGYRPIICLQHGKQTVGYTVDVSFWQGKEFSIAWLRLTRGIHALCFSSY